MIFHIQLKYAKLHKIPDTDNPRGKVAGQLYKINRTNLKSNMKKRSGFVGHSSVRLTRGVDYLILQL